MINKILMKFGLMKISTAECLSATLYMYYARCVMKGVKNDFGREIPQDATVKASKWWRESFKKMVKSGHGDVTIVNPVKFKEE